MQSMEPWVTLTKKSLKHIVDYSDLEITQF